MIGDWFEVQNSEDRIHEVRSQNPGDSRQEEKSESRSQKENNVQGPTPNGRFFW